MGARKYFGTDGIRGRVGQGVISADFVLRLGNALGRVLLAQRGQDGRRPIVVIGKDTRISGYMFEAALEAGLVAAGADVQLLGPMPTPAVAFLTRTLGVDAGIVISASHNPHYDNGIKFFSAQGEKLDDATELALEAALDVPFTTAESEKLGKAFRAREAVGRYIEFCKASVPRTFDLRGLRLVLDCAHGATYQIAPLLFRELGAEVIGIGAEPNGININAGVGSTHIDNLAAKVRETGADLGIAFDGDGDRVLMADDQGNPVDGDDLLYILARAWKAEGRLRGPVVGTLMSNYGIEKALADLQIPFVRSNVGDRYVHQALIEGGGVLGGEASGHLLCLDRATTGDGIVSALQVLVALRNSGQTLRQALKGLVRVPQKTVNVRLGNVPAKTAVQSESVQSALAVAQQAVAGRGRAFLRPSGTEPVVRVTVEADDATLMQDSWTACPQRCVKPLPEARAHSHQRKTPRKAGAFFIQPAGAWCLWPRHHLLLARFEAIEQWRDQRVVALRDALAQPAGRAVADREAVDPLRITADHVAAERVGGVQVAEALLACHLDVVLVEIAVGPAQRIGHLAELVLQDVARDRQIPAEARTALRTVQIVAAQPAGVGVGMAMHFEGAGGNGCACFAPAHHHIVAAVLLVDRRFAATMVRRRRQCRAGNAGVRTFRAFAHPAGDHEHHRVHAVLLQDRVRIHPVVEIAIVEGDDDRLARHRLAGQEAGVLLQRQ